MKTDDSARKPRDFVTKAARREKGASCASCMQFHSDIPESRMNPAELADCGHPRFYALLTANRHFPFAQGCKFWVPKHQLPL